MRREKELEATVKRLADAERYRIQTEAEANRFKFETEARGQADAQKAKGFAQAEVVKATGTAEADVIAVKGTAEAQAMAKKANSWKEYNQAAIIQLVLQALPEIAQAIAQPLSKTESITIVNTGGDNSGRRCQQGYAGCRRNHGSVAPHRGEPGRAGPEKAGEPGAAAQGRSAE